MGLLSFKIIKDVVRSSWYASLLCTRKDVAVNAVWVLERI